MASEDRSQVIIPRAVYDYLESQSWVKTVISSGGVVEVAVDKKMNTEIATRKILSETELRKEQLEVTTFVNSQMTYL